MEDLVPRHITLRIIELLGKCKCERCQKEKKKIEDKLYGTNPIKSENFNPINERIIDGTDEM